MTRHNKIDKNKQAHDNLVDKIELLMNQRGYETTQGHEYDCIKCGELDLLAWYNDKYALLFEIKLHDTARNYKHAQEQTERAVIYCPELRNKRVFRFYIGGYDDGNYKLQWLRRFLYYPRKNTENM